jgi:hypothetical protein
MGGSEIAIVLRSLLDVRSLSQSQLPSLIISLAGDPGDAPQIEKNLEVETGIESSSADRQAPGCCA